MGVWELVHVIGLQSMGGTVLLYVVLSFKLLPYWQIASQIISVLNKL